MIKIGINGFGRIGRLVCRHVLDMRKEGIDIAVAAVNDLGDTEYLAYRFKYDSVHGQYQGTIEWDSQSIVIDGMKIMVSQCRDPADIPWGSHGADVVCESTGFFTTLEAANKHLEGGAKKVVVISG